MRADRTEYPGAEVLQKPNHFFFFLSRIADKEDSLQNCWHRRILDTMCQNNLAKKKWKKKTPEFQDAKMQKNISHCNLCPNSHDVWQRKFDEKEIRTVIQPETTVEPEECCLKSSQISIVGLLFLVMEIGMEMLSQVNESQPLCIIW